MPKYWMISDRNVEAGGLGADRDDLTYWVSDSEQVDDLKKWKQVPDGDEFRDMLVAAADAFPAIEDPELNEEQHHVTLFVHGFNNDWSDAALRYKSVCKSIFSGSQKVGGLCVLFTWPSDGMALGYLPDRADAREAGVDLAQVLSELYDWLLVKQRVCVADSSKACKAKTSLIAHSMGNYVLQNAMQLAWTRKNQPLLVSLINQLIMVAADVDNDLFRTGENVDKSDGDAISNLTYRVTALYTGRDSVLGMSAGLKHFGKRRLGRSGLDRTLSLPDNVWDVDCSKLFPDGQSDIHSAYFDVNKTQKLMREILRGVDRTVLTRDGIAPGAAPMRVPAMG